MAMEKARKAHRPCVFAKVLRLYDMFTNIMTQQAVLLDQTSECSCASAAPCCVCGHVEDKASVTTCATCMMNYHKECMETVVQYVVYIANVLLCHQLLSKERCVKCVWHRTCSKLLTRGRCRPCLATNAVSYLSWKKCHRKIEHGRESNMFIIFFSPFDSISTSEIVRQRGTEPSRRTRWRTNGNSVKNLPHPANRVSPRHVFGRFVSFFCFLSERGFLYKKLLSLSRKNRSQNL